MTILDLEESEQVKELETELAWMWKEKIGLQKEVNALTYSNRWLKNNFERLLESVRQARALARWEGGEKVEGALASILADHEGL